MVWTLILLAFFPAAVQAAEDFGWVTATQQDARVVDRATGDLVPTKEGDTVLFMDTHQTGPGSKLRLLLEDESVLTLGERSQFQVTESLYDPKTQVRRLTGQLTAGVARALVGPYFSTAGSRFEVQTPTASVFTEQGGAYFIVWLAECDGAPATGILSLEGRVTARRPGAAEGVTLAELFYTRIGPTCPPALPLPVSEDMMSKMTEATSLIDPIRIAAMDIDEQIDPREDRPRSEIRLTPQIVQTPNLSSLTRVRVHVIFP